MTTTTKRMIDWNHISPEGLENCLSCGYTITSPIGATLSVSECHEFYVMSARATGTHRLARSCTDAARLAAHWDGFVETAQRALDGEFSLTKAAHVADWDAVRGLSCDDCVRKVTAFRGLDDMMDTGPGYRVKLMVSRADDGAAVAAMARVARAFNSQARFLGQARRALVY